MNLGKRVHLNRIFAHPSGRLCSDMGAIHYIDMVKLGGSANNSWMSDAAGPDNRYSFRTIRTTAAVNN